MKALQGLNFVDPDCRDWKDKWLGFFNALVDNMTNGVAGDRESGLSNASDANDYQTGLIAGDAFSLALGAAEIGVGGGMITGGEATAVVAVAAAPGTGGVSLVATAPGLATASVGAAMVGHGTMMMAKAAENLGETSRTVKESNTSEYTFTQGQGNNAKKVTTRIPDGYRKMNNKSHKQDVFYNGKNYISPDRDGHNGGIWKMAKKEKDLGSRNKRMGTYDENLNRIGD